MQELVRNFAEQLRQGHNSVNLSEDSSQAIPQHSKSQDHQKKTKVQQLDHQKKINLDAFRHAWQKQQDRQNRVSAPTTTQTIDQSNLVIAKNNQESTSKQQWDFEQGCWLSESSPPKSQSKVSVSTSPQITSLPTSKDNPRTVLEKDLHSPPSHSTNPWEMLRDHFIALRERRIAFEKTSDQKEQP